MYKILIVDDDRVIADTVKEQLIKWGYEARIVDDFNNVLKYLPNTDLILCLWI